MNSVSLEESPSTESSGLREGLARLSAAFKVIARNRLALIGLVIIVIGLFTAIFAPYLVTHDPFEINIADRLQGPSRAHWLGTDFMGRDTFTRLVFGSRTAFQVSVGAVLLGALLGIPIGIFSGYFGKWVDMCLMRVMDSLLAFPGRLLAIALVASLGGGLFSLYLAIGVSSIPSFARIVRAAVLTQKEREYVEAARMTGELLIKRSLLTQN